MTRSGCVEEASRNYQQALMAAADAAAPDVEAEALIGWAQVHCAQGRLSAALTDAGNALRIAHEGGYQLIGAIARSCLAAAHLQCGAVHVAQQHVEQALEFLQAVGARQEEGRAMLIFGDISKPRNSRRQPGSCGGRRGNTCEAAAAPRHAPQRNGGPAVML